MNVVGKLLGGCAVFSAGLLAVACAPETPSGAADGQVESSALSATSSSYVTLQHDLRKCAAPMCGGWFATAVDKPSAQPVYVASLDFAASGLDDKSQGDVTSATDGEVVVYGKLGPVGAHNTRNLIVVNAYRGMPGFAPSSTDAFYAVNGAHAAKLNTSVKNSVTSVNTSIGHFIQSDWLQEGVVDDGALVAGSIANHVLTASQVFLKLPVLVGPCPAMPVKQCPSGEVQTFTRSSDLCLVAQGCVTPGVCPLFVPYCGTEYTAESWARSPNGCSMVTCDPAWIH